VAGVLIAITAAPQLVSMLSSTRSLVRLDLQLDWRMLCFVAGVGTVVTFLFGLAPALRASAVSPNHALKSGGGKQTARIGVFRPLVAAQTAFGFIVLFVAGLCLASFAKLVRTDPGFDANDLAIVYVEAKEFREGDTKALAAWTQLVEHVNHMPEIESASLSGWVCSRAGAGIKACAFPDAPSIARIRGICPSPRASLRRCASASSAVGISNGAMRSWNRLRP
jgi:hypothetical protein